MKPWNTQSGHKSRFTRFGRKDLDTNGLESLPQIIHDIPSGLGPAWFKQPDQILAHLKPRTCMVEAFSTRRQGVMVCAQPSANRCLTSLRAAHLLLDDKLGAKSAACGRKAGEKAIGSQGVTDRIPDSGGDSLRASLFRGPPFKPSHPQTLAPPNPRNLRPFDSHTLTPSHPQTLTPSDPTLKLVVSLLVS